MRGIDECYVCGRKHETLHKSLFPKDFPNTMKICCCCKNIAKNIITCGLDGIISNYKTFECILGKLHIEKYIERCKKLYTIVTVA